MSPLANWLIERDVTKARSTDRIKGLVQREPAMLIEALARMNQHKTILESFGITQLSGLGTLKIDRDVIVQSGLLRPGPRPHYATTPTAIREAWVYDSTLSMLRRGSSTVAFQLNTEAFPAVLRLGATPAALVRRASGQVFREDAYWAAETIELADDTIVTFKYPNCYLTVLCEKLIVGKNVTFTWERPQINLPPTPASPHPKPNATSHGEHGQDGDDGVAGNKGNNGHAAPELELWVLEMSGKPIFDLSGQDGGKGGRGGNGGDAGDGAKGKPAKVYFGIDVGGGRLAFCESGPGDGGNGGKCGRPGLGGYGGNGGHGGKLMLYAPDPVLDSYRLEFNVQIAGGKAGADGVAGPPGRNGKGGAAGDNPYGCTPSAAAGRDGNLRPGAAKPADSDKAVDGESFADAIAFRPILPEDFRRKWLTPAISSLAPTQGHKGDRITIHGKGFTSSDSVVVDGQSVSTTTYVSDKELEFTVPVATGGEQRVEVRQQDGTLSSPGTLIILPSIDSVTPGPRLQPGSRVTLHGSGFARDCRVFLNTEKMTAVRFVSAAQMDFTPMRPTGITEKATGEPAQLRVALGTGESSNPIDVILDTFRILVVGDSVLWGQGLMPDQKIEARVKQGVQRRLKNLLTSDVGVYVTNRAHSGAVIGIGKDDVEDTKRPPALDPKTGLPQEVNTDYPTILQQVADFSDQPETIDLILVDGGINDVNVRVVLRTLDPNNLIDLIDLHCRRHMSVLLDRITQKFPKAKVIVTGYFPIISDASDVGRLTPYLIGLNLLDGVKQALGVATIDETVQLKLAANCAVLYEHSEMALQRAVDDTNAKLIQAGGASTARIFLAAPEFDPQNASLAPDSWLYGLTGPLGEPEDDPSVRDARSVACDEFYQGDFVGGEVCKRASAGHPNLKGAEAFANEILAVIDINGLLGWAGFPDSFLWGPATAAFQVEGHIENNDWHIFTNTKSIHDRVEALGKVVHLEIDLKPAGEAAGHADQRGRITEVLRQDLDRMVALGMNAYRFSIEWSRVQPRRTRYDNDALQYYDNVIEEVRNRGLKPIITLNHLTLPDWVLTPSSMPLIGSAAGVSTVDADAGFNNSMRGWENDDTVDAFVEFVTRIVDRYKDRVDIWITLNEPVASMIGVGYVGGVWSPGFVFDGTRARRAYFNLIRAHAKAYDAIKDLYGPRSSFVGIAHAMMFAKIAPASDPHGVSERARLQFNYFFNWHILNSLSEDQVDVAIEQDPDRRTYQTCQQCFGLPFRRRMDFIGINYYRSVYVNTDPVFDALMTLTDTRFQGGKFEQRLDVPGPHHHLLNDLAWEIYPRGLYALLKKMYKRYPLPILITENGIAEENDLNRAAFIVSHLQQTLRAIKEGVNVMGYLHWSIVDNFEWFENFNQQSRFGLFTMNLPGDQTRHITEGALALQYIIAENGIGLAVEKFGTINSKGYLVSPPLRSPGSLWEGSFRAGTLFSANQKFTLYLSQLSTGTWLGMVFLRLDNAWHRLENLQRSGNSLSFSLAFGGGKHVFQATVTGDAILGTAKTGTQSQSWQAQRVRLFGNWASGNGPAAFQVRRLEGEFEDWRVKVHGAGKKNRQWNAGTQPSSDGATLAFNIGTNRVDAQLLADGTLSGTSTSQLPGVGAVKWQAVRLGE